MTTPQDDEAITRSLIFLNKELEVLQERIQELTLQIATLRSREKAIEKAIALLEKESS